MSLKKTVIFTVLAALTTSFALTPFSSSASSVENTSVSSVSSNPYRTKFTPEYAARIDRLVQSVLARGKDLPKDAYVAYLTNISDAMTKLAAQEKYRNKQEVQEIVGYLNFEISKIRGGLVDGTTFMEDLATIINASAPVVQSPVNETPRQPSPVDPVPVTPTVAVPKIPLPTLQISNMSDGSAYVSWTYVQGQKYNLNYVGGLGGNLRNEMDFTSAMMGGCTYKRSIGNGIVLCSGKWNNFPGAYSIQTYNADGSKGVLVSPSSVTQNSAKFDWEDAYSAQQIQLREEERLATIASRPNRTSSGVFVRTKKIFTGNLGGLSGANEKCLQQLVENEWIGKERFQLDSQHVRAYLCDSLRCQNLRENTSYYGVSLDTPESDYLLGKTDRYGRIVSSEPENGPGVLPFGRNHTDSWGNGFLNWSGRSGYVTPATNTCKSWTTEEPTRNYHSRSIDSYAANDQLGAVARENENRNPKTWDNSSESCSYQQALACVVEL